MHAIIDIGTNSLLLLIAEATSDGDIQVIEDIATVTKLGEGLSASGVISAAAAERTIHTLSKYLRFCIDRGAEEIVVVGTAALRNAKNAPDFCLFVKKELGLDIRIIPGEEEAKLTFEASAHDFGEEICVIDIGGGSTEIIERGNNDKLDSKSLQIGCVNLTERFLKSDPTTEDEVSALQLSLRSQVRGLKSAAKKRLVATAGTATTLMAMKLRLSRYARSAVHGKTLSADWLRNTICDLQSKSVEERKTIAGLPSDRADVILAGAIILDEAMRSLGYDEVVISDAGVKWGLLYNRFR